MKTKADLQQAYVLHARAFRNTSLILELFTERDGRIGAVARGARGTTSKVRGILQPFVPILIRCFGRGELLTLQDVEPCHRHLILTGQRLISGFYLNELLLRLLAKQDPHPELFHYYATVLQTLEHVDNIEPCLRTFEKKLLIELGYGMAFDREAVTGDFILKEAQYHYQQGLGFVRLKPDELVSESLIFTGASLLDFHTDQLHSADSLKSAKRLMRMRLAGLLGERPLRTRELF